MFPLIGNRSNNKMVKNLNKEEFKTKVFDFENKKDWKYEGKVPAIIDFYADWCGPCKMIAPVLDELAKDYEGKINIYKVNTEEEKELAGAFGIMSIPSLLFVPLEGKPQMLQGALPKDGFVKVIKDILLKEE
jgi:thioredoxin